MTTYLVAAIDVTDADRYERYRSKVAATVAGAGGRYLVRGGPLEVLEGTWPGSRTVVVAFSSRELALAFYRSDAYQQILPDRLAASTGSVVIVEGVDAA